MEASSRDAAVLSYNYLQVYYYNEIQRGFCGIGSYSDFSCLKCEADEQKILKAVPASIVASIRPKVLSNIATVVDDKPVDELPNACVLHSQSTCQYHYL